MDPRDPWARDPGWSEAVRNAWMFVVPFGLQLRMRKLSREGADGLIVLRTVQLAFAGAVVIFGIVLTFLFLGASDPTATAGWVAAALVVFGGLMIFVVTPRIERPLPCDSDAALAGAFRTRFFLRIALAESVALVAFVATFMVRAGWLYYIGAAITLYGFALRAPTESNITRDQADLRQRGCGRSLTAALRRSQPPPSSR